MDDTITLKGIKQGLLVTVKSDGRWADATSRLTALIDSQGTFFKGAQVTLSLGPRELRYQELANVQKLLAKRDVTLLAVLSDSDRTSIAAQKLGVKTDLTALELQGNGADALPLRPPPIDPEERGTQGVLVKRTLRNGRTVHSDGHVVVLGDVNAGAVITAGGDVVV